MYEDKVTKLYYIKDGSEYFAGHSPKTGEPLFTNLKSLAVGLYYLDALRMCDRLRKETGAEFFNITT